MLGFTYNTINNSTQYQNGVDMHLDWAASQFLTKQFQFGVVGYVYNEVGCDSGSGDRVGCFQSRVIGVGPQVGFVIPMGTIQGYLNFKAYMEFDSANRPDGWKYLGHILALARGADPVVAETDGNEIAVDRFVINRRCGPRCRPRVYDRAEVTSHQAGDRGNLI